MNVSRQITVVSSEQVTGYLHNLLSTRLKHAGAVKTILTFVPFYKLAPSNRGDVMIVPDSLILWDDTGPSRDIVTGLDAIASHVRLKALCHATHPILMLLLGTKGEDIETSQSGSTVTVRNSRKIPQALRIALGLTTL